MRWKRIGVFMIALALTGCAAMSPKHGSMRKAKPGTLYIVKAETASFYKHRPQKSRNADRQLPKDMLLTVTRHVIGYSRVQLADGQEGFVANEDLIPASDTLLASAPDNGSDTDDSSPPTPEVTLPTADSSLEPNLGLAAEPLLPH